MNEAINNFLSQPFYESSALQVVRVNMPFDINAKNLEITKVYNSITKEIRYLLSRLSNSEARTYLISYSPIEEDSTHTTVYEFTCIMCSIRLSIYEDHKMIELETDFEIKRWIGEYNYDQLLRTAYRATMWEATQYNLEGCLQVNTEKIDHYDYWVKMLLQGENSITSIFIEPASNGLEDSF